MILPYSGEKLPSSIIAHVLHNVPGTKQSEPLKEHCYMFVPGVEKVCPWSLLMVRYRDIAVLTDSHLHDTYLDQIQNIKQ